MSQDKSKINCPRCGEEIDVNAILYHQVDEQLKKQYSDELEKEKEKYDAQASELKKDRKKLETEKSQQKQMVKIGICIKHYRNYFRNSCDLLFVHLCFTTYWSTSWRILNEVSIE